MNPLIKYYSRKDIQQELLRLSKNREIAAVFSDKGFGRRPDILQYEQDIVELVKKGATSFHISEEHWSNPLLLKPGMTKSQLDSLRTGFDLILDIDGPFEYSQIAAYLIVEALKYHNIENISAKFSGNKGLHIGIPFSSFPDKVHNIDTKLLFPEAPKIISLYLRDFIKEQLAAKILEKYSIEEILNTTKKQKEDILHKICKKCKTKATEKVIISYECKKCNTIEETYTEDYLECPNCKSSRAIKKKILVECPVCKTKRDFEKGEFNPFSVVDIDTILISNRHMYRSVFSYHEKSGLISVPIDPDSILNFKKEQAKIENVKTDIQYLRESNKPEASQLIMQAFDFQKKQEKTEIKYQAYDLPTKAVPQEYFPPCILNPLKNGLQDGKKRFLFILINFLKSLGYSHQEITLMVQEWNKKNKPPLRENYVASQVNYNKNAKAILPPNCSNEAYYKSLGICCPDNLCKLVKNPVNYALRKSKFRE